MKIVVDASMAAAWSFEDEVSEATERVAYLVEQFGAFVPQHFPIEIANVFMMAERRGRVPAAFAERALRLLDRMTLTTDQDTNIHAWHETLGLAEDERLTVYDAAYLELALRLGADLATLDKDLASAARRRGLTVLP